MSNKIKKLIITGSNSFIGKHLIPFFESKGYEMLCLTRSQIDQSLLKPSSKLLKTIYMQGDLSNADFLQNLDWKPDVILHLAANRNNLFDTQKMLRDNVISAINLISYAKNVHCHKIINFSSISIHGLIKTSEISELTEINNPNLYGMTKRIAEILFRESSFLTSVYSLRLPAVIGFGASNHWLSRIVDQALSHRDIDCFSLDSKFNNAIYIRDLLEFIEILINSNVAGKFEFPISSKAPISVRKIIDLIMLECNSRSKIIEKNTVKKSFIINNKFAQEYFFFKPLTISSAVKLYVRDILSESQKINSKSG